MSGLIYKGNAVTGLGEFMPSAIIEKVYVNDGSLDLQLALYWPDTLDAADAAQFDGAVDKRLRFYAMLVFDQNNIDKVIDREANILSQAISDTIVGYEDTTGNAIPIGFHWLTNYIEFNLAEFLSQTPEAEIVYDTNEVPLYKYSINIPLPFEDSTLSTFSTFDEFFATKNLSTNKNITLFCFSTTYDLTDTDDWDWIWNTIAKSPENTAITPGHGSLLPDDSLPLIKRNIGDITYESIFVDGQVDTEPKVAYIDEEGVYFDEVPLMALNAEYYKPESVTHAEIIDKFNIILSSFDPDPETEIELSGVIDSISYALSVYGEDADILQQLNRIREASPERGSATKTGRLYDQFSSAIAATNRQIKSNDILHKVLYRSPKVIDARGIEALSNIVAPTPTTDDSEIIYTDALISRSIYATEEANWWTSGWAHGLNWGNVFCDFEKVLHRDTDIAQLMSTKKLETYFGQELLNSAVKPSFFKIHKKDRQWISRAQNWYVDTGLCYMDMVALPSGISWDTVTYPFQYAEYEYSADSNYDCLLTINPGYDGDEDQSWLALRSWTLASGQGLHSNALGHDYRLLDFQFQDYYKVTFEDSLDDQDSVPNIDLMGSTGGIGDLYEVDFWVADRSLQILKALKDIFETAYNAFSDYRILSEEHCHYNDMGSYFNSFFANAMTAQYGSNPADAPWQNIAFLYYLYLNLFDNTSNRSLAEITDQAEIQSTKLGPYAGTLEDILNFQARLDDLWAAIEGVEYAGAPTDHLSAEYLDRYSEGQILEYKVEIDLTETPVYVNIAGTMFEEPVVATAEPTNWYKWGSTIFEQWTTGFGQSDVDAIFANTITTWGWPDLAGSQDISTSAATPEGSDWQVGSPPWLANGIKKVHHDLDTIAEEKGDIWYYSLMPVDHGGARASAYVEEIRDMSSNGVSPAQRLIVEIINPGWARGDITLEYHVKITEAQCTGAGPTKCDPTRPLRGDRPWDEI